jgi:predicted NBD/HSP70 family sugar kinase
MIHDLLKTRADLGQRNRKLVLAEILFGGPIPRGKIAERIGLTAASVSRISRDLIESGVIEEGEYETDDNRPGRRFIGLKVKPSGCFVVGIAINAFQQDVVVADLTNAALFSRKVKIKDLSNAIEVLETCAKTLNALIDDSAIDRSRLISCGFTITGAVDPQSGVLGSAPALGWKNINAVEILSKHLDIPVFMDNIPNSKNIAVHNFGSTREAQNVVLFNASLGIGCSLLLDGRLHRGSKFRAGLIDDLLIPDERSSALKSVDQLAGGFAVLNDLQQRESEGGADLAYRLIRAIDDANRGDQNAINALVNAGRSLAYVITATQGILHPEQFLLSGPLMESEIYFDAIRAKLTESHGPEFVQNRLRWVRMSSQEAAHSLAIYQSLVQGKIPDQRHSAA